MAHEDLREFIGVLEEKDELKRIPLEVHWKYEIGGWVRKTMDLRPKGPALLFENLKGHNRDYRILCAAVDSYPRFALALGLDAATPVKEIIGAYKERLHKPIKPIMVSTGPVKENVHTGDDVDLLEFPVPWWTPRDGGRYIGTWHGNVTKEPATGVRNVGMYRVMIHDKRHAGVGFLPSKEIAQHFAEMERQGRPLEMAVVIGADETIPMVASASFPPAVDEYDMAGGLREAPIALVKCETVDLEVPANAEIVLEGHILPFERKEEGPLSEHTGYHGGGVRMRTVFEVTAICHRNQPILRGALLGKPITENHTLHAVENAANAMRMFETHGPSGVVAVCCPPEGDSMAAAVVAMRPHYVGHSRIVGRALLSSPHGRSLKYVVVVDEDIDPFDLGQVWWAIIYRTQGSRDIEVLRFGPCSRSDPSVPRSQGEYTDKVLIDATKKLDYPFQRAWGGHWAPVGFPPRKVMELVDLRWAQIFEGKRGAETQIGQLTRELATELFPKWETWREKHYKLTAEEREREIHLSLPTTRQEEEME
ncbi:MAG: UbiD family decarboxylase [Chloroflexi bacterium]|nr:UbiD family decarboxylase [Chloroflexota bacterium]